MTSRTQLLWAACAGIFVFGITLAVLGVLFGLPEMRERLGVNLVQQGNVLLSLFSGVLLSTLISGPLIDSYGNKIVLTVSALTVTVAFLVFSAAVSFPAAVGAGFLLGFGGGGLNNSTNALVAALYAENRGAMLNVLGTFFGVGALAVPLAAALLRERFSMPQLLVGAGVMAAALTVWFLFVPFPPPPETVGFSMLGSLRAAQYPGVLLFAAILFCQSGNESSIGGWTSTYLGTLGASPLTATLVLSGYWGALMLGRLAGARILSILSKPRLILIAAIGSVLGSAMIVTSRSIPLVAAGAILSGLSFATIYPTILAIAADRYQRSAGTIFGFLFAVGLIGGMLFPWLIGHVSQTYSVRAGMAIPVIGALAVATLAQKLPKRGQV